MKLNRCSDDRRLSSTLSLIAVLACPLNGCDRAGDPGASAAPAGSNSAIPALTSDPARPEPLPAPAPPVAAAPKLSLEGFTAGRVSAKAELTAGSALLTDVRSARHDGFDRVVFELSGSELPGYQVEYIDKPVRRCGSGEPTALAGDGWLEVRFTNTNAHTPSGAPTIARREQQVELAVVRELEQTCDFEAEVTWVIGVARPNRFRVLPLKQPARIAVDIAH